MRTANRRYRVKVKQAEKLEAISNGLVAIDYRAWDQGRAISRLFYLAPVVPGSKVSMIRNTAARNGQFDAIYAGLLAKPKKVRKSKKVICT